MASGNFLYPWARNKFLAGSLAWSGAYKVMFLNAGVNTQYTWSATGASGYAWNPVSGSEVGDVMGATPAAAGYAITYLSQIPTGHRSITTVSGGLAGVANTLGITAVTSYGNGVANAAAASTTQLAVPSGTSINAFVIYNEKTGIDWKALNASSYIYESAMELVAFFDSAIGMPVSGNGGDITVVWDTSSNKIFKL